MVCNDLNVNALEVINMANKHSRVNLHKPGLYGLTYKGNVDDIRESPALEILNLLREENQ
jgi:UDP-N-acetyl-D-mannosaminuronate dehydrogenase